ncbi:extracellular solute-binding protein [Paenibacillus sp. LHD-38]|uniref:extracellular solute-binding protein n=1 Tax=Paenibacillus sp. LHD-38 TaxID=3072143 RepID=UPI00280F0A2B|nr:extracellular solute-binding protein [Paenibacillus sp. LHD-38]MDQ8734714.1 extracellular solute-binding protein [Paenibacillus sp. LHD-38]
MLKNKKWVKLLSIPLIASMFLAGCSGNGNGNNEGQANTSNKGTENVTTDTSKPATWIADRKVKGLVFMGTDDYTEDMNDEIKAQLKESTGIDLEIEIMVADHSIDGLIAGLASNDLPDFITFYLNNSGRPEMSVILKAARENMFTDLTPLMKKSKVYSKYLQDDYLPLDTKYGVMFRPEFNGSSYFVHMNVARQGGYATRKYAGGPYIRKDIAEALNIDPRTVNTTDELYELAKKINEGNFKDKNGKDVVPIGPAYWGGKEVGALFNDLEWGADDQRIKKDKDGNILHESQTEFALKKVEYVQKLLNEKLLHPEFFTIDESRATEGALNETWGIIADTHNYQEYNKDMHYLPLGPIDFVDRPYQMQVDYKSGYSAWAIPATTKNPEDIMKLADFLASREGKLLWQYGLEGRDYTLDAKGNPLAKKEVIDLKTSNPEEAKKLGFGGVANYWGELLGGTDIDRMADFGEMEYGDAVAPEVNAGALKIAEYWGWDEKRKNAKIVDGYTPLSFIGEFEQGTELKTAFENYDDSLIRAYYAKNADEAKKILDSASKQLEATGLKQFLELLKQKDSDPKTHLKF